ncbi:hypothetical protein M5K25_009680 [Dendrobium thyrsiflorum]|uniref:Uncharacterized protein n=1 Tax=Dendrobium thyrsiflorum TaxID=117978 RepID=A0ABD0V6F7_DENTH
MGNWNIIRCGGYKASALTPMKNEVPVLSEVKKRKRISSFSRLTRGRIRVVGLNFSSMT